MINLYSQVTEFGSAQYLAIHNDASTPKRVTYYSPHQSALTDDLSFQQWFAIALRTYFPAMLAVKLCLLLGFHRIFKIDQRTRYLIWGAVIVNSILYTLFFLYGMLRCKPIRAAWDPKVDGKCVSHLWVTWFVGVFNVISDFYILILPMPIVLTMKMETMRRIRLVSIFGLGLL